MEVTGHYGLIDNRFRVIRRFGVDHQDINKQVYLVEDILGEFPSPVILKSFMTWEYADFEREARNNLEMPNGMARSVKMLRFVAPHVPKQPYSFYGGQIEEYAYILIPYVRGTSLIEFLMKASKKGKKLSIELVGYLFLQMYEAVVEFQKRTGKSHLDLKPDNFILTEDGQVKLIDFCHASPSYLLT
jgi:serine/threonine protein kinase